MTNRRFLSLWLPRLSTDLARRAHEIEPHAALAVVATEKNARRLTGVDVNAERLGLTPGLTLADARARHPALVSFDADLAGQARWLENAADAASRYTPLVALDGADGLMLDVSGVAHLFGGEAGLVADAEARFARARLTLRAGLADTPRAAAALARFGREKIAPPGSKAKPSPGCSMICRSQRWGSRRRWRASSPARACGGSAIWRCARARRSSPVSAPT